MVRPLVGQYRARLLIPAWLVFPTWHRLKFVPGMVAALPALTTLSGMTVALARRGIRIPI